MVINIPSQVNSIIEILHSHGYEAYVVGGACRDMLMGKSANDWDVATSALPEETKAVFASYGEMNANGTPIQSITYCTVDSSAEPVTFAEPMLFSESADFIWLDNSNIMSVRAIAADGKTAGSVVYTY